MRKLFFLIFFILATLSLGSDFYRFVNAPEKGFQLSDIGVLWEKYHPESHDQWKLKLSKFSNEAIGLAEENFSQPKDLITNERPTSQDTAEEPALLPITEDPEDKEDDYLSDFKITQTKGAEPIVEPADQPDIKEESTNKLLQAFAMFLKQKAVLVFGIIALLLYLSLRLGKPKGEGKSYRYAGKAGKKAKFENKYKYKRR